MYQGQLLGNVPEVPQGIEGGDEVKYIVTVPITQASGTREYEVEAKSPEQAIKKARSGNWPCVSEQFEAEELEFEFATVEKAKYATVKKAKQRGPLRIPESYE